MKRLAFLLALGLSVFATAASAELVGSGGQIASFEAKLSPSSLPRLTSAPVKIRVEGEFHATKHNHLAQLESVEIELNRSGELITKGLPVCKESRLLATSTSTALKTCGRSLVGHGLMRTKNLFPEQTASLVKATILVFYSRGPGGGKQFLLHVFARRPVPFTVVVPVSVRSVRHGRFGTAFFADLPPLARRWAYLTKFKFVLGRTFLDHGREVSVLRASCPAPNGFNAAVFPFARATYRFRTTKTLRATLIGGCHVRGR